jgi:putative oxidoreductase
LTLRIIPERFLPHAQGALRIVVALLFLQHGTAKLFGYPYLAQFDHLQTFSLLWFGGVMEFVGGVLMLVGWLTRPAAFLLSGEMAVAYFGFHAFQALWPIHNKGELAALYCFVFLFFSVAGPGKYSFDGE